MTSLVEIRGLTVTYVTPTGTFSAVESFDLDIRQGETVGLAGESGSGKSTLALSMMRLLRSPGRVVTGSILIAGEDLLAFSREQLAAWRWNIVSMVFQSAMNALNPATTLFTQFHDVLADHLGINGDAARSRAEMLADLVDIPRDRLDDYPHQFSGGMRQRAVLAIALALEPKLLILDEPTTALDVVVQREILDRLLVLKERLGLSILFITHDLALLSEFADRIGIMRGGRLVEIGATDQIRLNPQHAYTQQLWQAMPRLAFTPPESA